MKRTADGEQPEAVLVKMTADVWTAVSHRMMAEGITAPEALRRFALEALARYGFKK